MSLKGSQAPSPAEHTRSGTSLPVIASLWCTWRLVPDTVHGEDSEHHDGQAQWPQEGGGGQINTPWETLQPMWVKQLITADHSWGQGGRRGGPLNSRGDLDSATSHHAGAGGLNAKDEKKKI